MFRLDLLQNDLVRYANQSIAVVIAETLEAATEGAALLSPQYETQPARVGLDAGESFVPPAVGVGNPSELRRGDVAAGLVAATRRIDAITRRPPNITTRWSRTRSSRHGMATNYRSTRRARASPWRRADRGFVRYPSGQYPYSQPVPGRWFRFEGPDLRAADPRHHGGAARWPAVKLVLRREQMYGPVGHRAPTRQTLRVGADSEAA